MPEKATTWPPKPRGPSAQQARPASSYATGLKLVAKSKTLTQTKAIEPLGDLD